MEWTLTLFIYFFSSTHFTVTHPITAIPIFGNWREIHTASDLGRANAELHYLSDQAGRREYIKAIGKRLLAEANDLKRPLDIVAEELHLEEGIIDELMNGNVEVEQAHAILKKVNVNYPVSLNALWVEPNDTIEGVRFQRASQAEASRRVLSRANKHQQRTPYYEYRDVAMSRLGPFRPEWIKELRVVNDNDPYNPDVAYNNGHLLFQTTFFIGPVNFYYDLGEDHGGKICVPMNTGDSNWIAPFVPHSFTSRDPSQFACIIACTYGAQIITSLQTLSDLGDGASLLNFSGDMRNPITVFEALIQRHMNNDNLTMEGLIQELENVKQNVKPEGETEISLNTKALVEEVLVGKGKKRLPTFQEVKVLSGIVHCLPEDLMVTKGLDEPVLAQHRGDGVVRYLPNREKPYYRYERLASSDHHSLIKSFDMRILGGQERESGGASPTSGVSPSDNINRNNGDSSSLNNTPNVNVKSESLSSSIVQGDEICFDASSNPPWIQMPCHSFIYNYSDDPVRVQYTGDIIFYEKHKEEFQQSQSSHKDKEEHSSSTRAGTINPGDSIYVMPNIPHRFHLVESRNAPQLYVVRIPGHLTKEVITEVSLCDQRGRARIMGESMRWYN